MSGSGATAVSADLVAASRNFEGTRWVATMDLGRSLVGMRVGGDAPDVGEALARSLATNLLPFIERENWPITVLLGRSAMRSAAVVDLLRDHPMITLGVRLFAEESPGESSRLDALRSCARQFEESFGRPPRIFRGEPEDLDERLGPELTATGFSVDLSARPDLSRPTSLPVVPWFCSAEGQDLRAVGRGDIWCLPTLVQPGGDFDIVRDIRSRVWNLSDVEAPRDLPYFLEFLHDLCKRAGRQITFTTTMEGDELAAERAVQIRAFLEKLVPLARQRGAVFGTADPEGPLLREAREDCLPAPKPCPVPPPVPPAEGRISFCVITNGKRPEKLRRLVSSIEAQGMPSYEIVVIGRPPVDARTHRVFDEEAADQGFLGRMRNAGVIASRGDWLVILDDDFLLPEGWFDALRALRPAAHVLSAEVRLPDGGRYWDHVTIEGPRNHQILQPGEVDDFSYVTGGGGWLISRVAATHVAWNEDLKFYEAEDVDFSRRLREAGFAIEPAKGLVSLHGDERYTSCGRNTLFREDHEDARWVIREFERAYEPEITGRAIRLIETDSRAEAWDVVRYGCLRYPDSPNLTRLRGILESRQGGPLEGSRYDPEGDRLWTNTLSFVARHDLAVVRQEGATQ